MGALLVQPNIELIDLHLAHSLNGSAQMILQRVTGDTGKDVNQAIVAEPRQQGLFVAECVFCDYTWCRVGNFCHGRVFIGENRRVFLLAQSYTGCARLGG